MLKSWFYNKFIIFLYMFRALLCSSSGSRNCVIQHQVSSHTVGGRPVHRLGKESSTCFEHCCAHHQGAKLCYTASGIITHCRWPSGAQVGRGVLYMFRALLCSSSGGRNCVIQHLVSSHTVGGHPVYWLREESSTCFEQCCAHHQEVEIVLYSTWYHHTH
jgi:hypothetical protein